ncbi:MAG: hypothetical protein R2712_11285 [Vicinamibacterales bacterium]
MVSVAADPGTRVSYGELIGGRRFNVALSGANIDETTGLAPVKPVQALRNAGQSPQRYDIPAKVDGSLEWAVDVKLPGMVHARNVKPPFAGATLTSVDEASVRDLPDSSASCAAATTWPWCANVRNRPFAPRASSRRRGRSRHRRPSRRPTTSSTTCAAPPRPSVHRRRWLATRPRP